MSPSDESRPFIRPRAGERLAELVDFEVVIEKLVAGGDGLARFEGIPIFVPFSAPGDHLRVTLVERRPDYGRARIVEVLKAGEARRDPPCPHFGRCGGCDLQHLDDEAQAGLKAGAVLETLQRLGAVPSDTPSRVLAAESWAYRLRAQIHFEVDGESVRSGYFARGSHELVDVASCPILVPELDALLPRLSEAIVGGPPKRVDLAVGDDGRISAAPVVEGLPRGEISRQIAGHRYFFDARCFFQAHRGLLEQLVEAVVGDDLGESAVDLFAGVGLFTLPLAKRYERVTAVEGDRVAARYVRKNTKSNGISNVEVFAWAIDSWIEKLTAGTRRVIVDPPRIGLSKRVRELLVERRPERLTYVSCHPAAMARDLKALAAGYRVDRLDLIDLFPQTGHMEAVAHLESRG